MAYRHELKHSINYFDYLTLQSRLKSVFNHDENGDGSGSYLVSTLYFDSPYDKALQEKMDGVNYREKFRLRYYNHDTRFIRLEKKSKENSLCVKKQAMILKEQCEQVIAGKFSFLADSNEPLYQELYHKMQVQQLHPKTIVEYVREAYIFPAGNVRITIDRNIRTSLYSTDFFCSDLPMVDVEGIILEVKYDAYLPRVVSNLIQIGRKSSSFSKYANSRISYL